MRNTLINLSLLLGTLLIFFGGTEGALRIAGYSPDRERAIPIYQKSGNEDISYELQPNSSNKAFRSTVTVNSLGFRGEEPNQDKQPIVFLGDSIAFGYGLEDEETIPAQVGTLLPDERVTNAAVPGYNLKQETATYIDKVKELDAKLIAIVFHFNDMENGGGEAAVLDNKGILRAPDWVPQERVCNPITTGIMGYIPGKCWLDLHSSFYRVVKEYVTVRSNKKQAAELEEEQSKGQDTADERITLTDLNAYMQQLQILNRQIPTSTKRLFIIWPEWYTHETVRPEFIKRLQWEGFTVIDMYDHFGNSPRTLGWDTVHPHAETAKEAAEIIAEEIKDMLGLTAEEQENP